MNRNVEGGGGGVTCYSPIRIFVPPHHQAVCPFCTCAYCAFVSLSGLTSEEAGGDPEIEVAVLDMLLTHETFAPEIVPMVTT